MAEEKEDVLINATLWLQKQEERLRNGFSVEYKGEEFTFVPKYTDRYANSALVYIIVDIVVISCIIKFGLGKPS